MSLVVWKYKLTPGHAPMELPHGAKVVHVDTQGDDAFMWVECDPREPTEWRRFEVMPTGKTFEQTFTDADITYEPFHRGTFLLRHLGLVFHLYEWAPLQEPPF